VNSSVLGLIFNKDQTEILLTKRRDVPVWVFPGGGVEIGEKPEEAVIREIFEETGLKVSIVRKTGEYFPLNRLAKQTHIFQCQVLSGKPRLSDETSGVNFFPLPHLPTAFFTVHQDWLSDALKNPYSVTRGPISQVTYLAVVKYFFKHPIHVLLTLLSRLGLPLNR
jgi:8-oxo-dGTP pyrophosphatase MutT (NUDIX family)